MHVAKGPKDRLHSWFIFHNDGDLAAPELIFCKRARAVPPHDDHQVTAGQTFPRCGEYRNARVRGSRASVLTRSSEPNSMARSIHSSPHMLKSIHAPISSTRMDVQR